MNASRGFLWLLSIQNKQSNVLALGTKAIVFSWWSFKTHMSPNQKEVVQRRLAPHLYEEKTT
jgi:hypothetical protein